jgi:hypothetical protein
VLASTIRGFKPEVGAKMLHRANSEGGGRHIECAGAGDQDFTRRGTKAVINNPGVVATAEKVLKTAFGDSGQVYLRLFDCSYPWPLNG